MTITPHLRPTLKVVAMMTVGIFGMIWAFTKIAVVTHDIGAGEAWLYVFGVMSLIGIAIIVGGAIGVIKSIRD